MRRPTQAQIRSYRPQPTTDQTMKAQADKQKVLVENAIALAAAVFTSGQYPDFYEAVLDTCPHPGELPALIIYGAIERLAVELTEWEERNAPPDDSATAYEAAGFDWLEFAGALATRMMEHAITHDGLIEAPDITMTGILAAQAKRPKK